MSTQTHNSIDKVELIPFGVASLGCFLAMLGFWMYLEAGGTLIQQPNSDLYLIPSILGFVLCLIGHAGIFGGRRVRETPPIEKTKQAYVTGELTELELEEELEQHEDALLETE